MLLALCGCFAPCRLSNGKGFFALSNTVTTGERKEVTKRTKYMREYWKKHPDKYAKHLDTVREYMRKRRSDPKVCEALKDKDAIARLRNKGYTITPPDGGNANEVHRSDELP